LGFALEVSMNHNANSANLGEVELITFQFAAVPVLGEAEAVVSVLAAKSWIAGFLPVLAAAEECFEGEVDTDADVLQNLTVDRRERGAIALQPRQRVELIVKRHSFLALFPGSLSLLQKVIVEPTTLVQRSFERTLSFRRRIDAVPEGFHCSCSLYRRAQTAP